MSTNVPPPTTAPAPAPAVPHPAHTPDEIRVVSHSQTFYWWPVWAVGFLMGIWSYFGGSYLVTVPSGTKAIVADKITYTDAKNSTKVTTDEPREIYMAPPGKQLPRREKGKPEPSDPWLHISTNKNLGVIFCIVLLLVIVITNVPLRGMWSVVVIITIVLVSVILALLQVWEVILSYVHLLDIRLNSGGYFFISIVLFIIWAVATFLFDQQTYIIFTPNQFKVCQSIGDGEKVFDNIGMTVEKRKGDVFRHYILGLGSGDLIVRTTGAQADHFDLPNVLWIGRKLQMIEALRDKRGGTGK